MQRFCSSVVVPAASVFFGLWLPFRPLGLAHAAPGPRPFLQAAPVAPQDLAKGEVPRQFTFALFGDSYLCERLPARAGDPFPLPEPASAASDAASVQPVCDGEGRLVFRSDGRTAQTERYSFATECREAEHQFRENGGCFCSPKSAITCIERGFVLEKIGAAFSFSSECKSALKGLARDVEVRFKPTPAR